MSLSSTAVFVPSSIDGVDRSELSDVPEVEGTSSALSVASFHVAVPLSVSAPTAPLASSTFVDAAALASVAFAEAVSLADDAASAFAAVTNSNPWETANQGKRNYLIATQNYLNLVARKFKGVRSAEVVISMPERVGFGRTSVSPFAVL